MKGFATPPLEKILYTPLIIKIFTFLSLLSFFLELELLQTTVPLNILGWEVLFWIYPAKRLNRKFCIGYIRLSA